ncbi:hypothetical protein DPSP01_008079 [Paraphaeosphaeria sporulosa]
MWAKAIRVEYMVSWAEHGRECGPHAARLSLVAKHDRLTAEASEEGDHCAYERKPNVRECTSFDAIQFDYDKGRRPLAQDEILRL